MKIAVNVTFSANLFCQYSIVTSMFVTFQAPLGHKESSTPGEKLFSWAGYSCTILILITYSLILKPGLFLFEYRTVWSGLVSMKPHPESRLYRLVWRTPHQLSIRTFCLFRIQYLPYKILEQKGFLTFIQLYMSSQTSTFFWSLAVYVRWLCFGKRGKLKKLVRTHHQVSKDPQTSCFCMQLGGCSL